MKKKNNKLIILIIVGIIFIVSLGVFILNYSKDDSSFSILEKKWINDNASTVLDVSVFNDVPVYGNNGIGVIFDMLDDFTSKYGINFNKVSYLTTNDNVSYRDMAFKVLDNNVNLNDNDILLYEDKYILISNKNEKEVNKISDMSGLTILALSSDVSTLSNYLNDIDNISYTAKDSISGIEEELKGENEAFAIIPYNIYLDIILKNKFNILYHLDDINKKYVLTINNNSLLNIFKKYYITFKNEKLNDSYKKNFLEEYFTDMGVESSERMSYNSNSYNVGYITYMPFEDKEKGEFVGTLSNYLSGFEDLFDVDFKLVYYNSIEELKKALSSGEVDLVFKNFNDNGLSGITKINLLFEEEYVILSKNTFSVNSIKSLKDKDVITIKDSYVSDYIINNGLKYQEYNNTDRLLRNVSKNSIVVIDKETYEYYKSSKFKDFYVLYTGELPYEYSFAINNKINKTFISMFDYYVTSINYNNIRYNYNTKKNTTDKTEILTFVFSALFIIVVGAVVFIIKKKKKNEAILYNNDKLRYIDAMTSLKNRTYLNYKIKEWDENVVYPQAFVVVDLNNIKDINDNHGHEEGDIVIKKAASILIVNQEANTDIIRTDGNEFLIYMVGYDEKQVVSYIRKIYKDLKDLPYGFGASVGYSMIMDDVKTVDDAINEATIDMRNKKENSQNG